MDAFKRRATGLLKWSEKYVRTDMIYLATGGFWLLISQIFLSGASFLMAIAFAHFVSKEVYGQYKYVLSVITLLGTFTLSGLSGATLQSLAHGYEGTLQYAFWKNIRWSVLFFIGAGGAAGYYLWHGNFFLGISMLIAGSLWPFWTSTNLYGTLLVAKKDFRRSSIYFDIIGNLIPYASLLAAMLFFGTPLSLVIAYFASNTLIGLILYRRVMNIYRPHGSVDPDMMSYSKHLSFIDVLAGIANNIDQVLVFHFIGPAELAVYNFATAMPDQIKGLVKNASGLIFPRFAERTDKEIRSGMNYKLFILFTLAIIIIAGYILIAPYVFKIFFPKYTDAIFFSQIYSLSLLWMVSVPASTYLSVKKKVRELYITNISTSLVQIIAVIIGVVYGGLIGLMIARVATRYMFALVSLLMYDKATA